jgi:hypothetical protein
MFDRIFLAALVFCVLAGGTLAIASAMFEGRGAERRVVQLPRVEVTGKRLPAPARLAKVEQASAPVVQ